MEFKYYKHFTRYRIFENGRIYSERAKKFINPSVNSKGYLVVSLCSNGKKESVSVHRLVGICFIPNPMFKPEINHKDGDKLNCDKSNLEWATRIENVDHATANGLTGYPEKNRKDLSFPITQYDLQGNFIKDYPSIKEAARQTGLTDGWIGKCVKGGYYYHRTKDGNPRKWINRNMYGGFIWGRQQVLSIIQNK